MTSKTYKNIIAFGTPDSVQINSIAFKKASNKIRTTRYTIITWFPKSLIWQFRRIDNFYFLLITILTCMSFSPKKPSTQVATFVIILVFTMVKEAIEDYSRYKQDKEMNQRKSLEVTNKGENIVMWENIRMGQTIKINKNEEIPADVLLIKSCKSNGIVYVDTMNIDGEVII